MIGRRKIEDIAKAMIIMKRMMMKTMMML